MESNPDVTVFGDGPDDPPGLHELWQLTPQERGPMMLRNPSQPERYEQERLHVETGLRHRDPELRVTATGAARHLAFSPAAPLVLRISVIGYMSRDKDGGVSGSSSGQRCLELWDYKEGKPLAIWEPDERWTCCEFTPDGSHAVTGSDRGIELRSVPDGRIEQVLSSEQADKLSISFDGRRVMAVGDEKSARLIEVDTGRNMQVWTGNRKAWQAFALNPDGTLVASGGADGEIHLWDATGQEIAHWPAHADGVTALLFSRNGDMLYSGGQEATLKVWNLPYMRKELGRLGLDWK